MKGEYGSKLVFNEHFDLEEELTYANLGESLIDQISLKAVYVEDDCIIQNNIFHTNCTGHGKVYLSHQLH